MPDLAYRTVRAIDARMPGLNTSTVLISPFPQIGRPSQGKIEGNVTSGGEHQSYSVPAEATVLEAALFRNKAECKLITSQVAMHLSGTERRQIFSALDRLLNLDDWEDESSEINTSAFRSFLRFIIYARPRRTPNLGAGAEGTVLTGWHSGAKSVHAEFLPQDQVMALISLSSMRGPERFAWRGHVARLREIINRNDALECID